jgi:SAM-dependent methyltransferase
MNQEPRTKNEERRESGAVFDAYAAYYDLLYRDKDYAGEAEYVHRLIQRHRPGAKTILELGSGTGRHACELAKRGYAVTGIERSPEMLEKARALVAECGGQRSDAGGQKSEVGGQRSDAGGQKSEVRGQRSDVGGQRSAVSGLRSDHRERTSDVRPPTSDLRPPISENRPPTSDLRPPVFHPGDLRTFSLPDRFDAAISLFHVISYLPENEDILAAFRNARRHLNPGGLFVFDVWYGPAVLTERPAVRVKRMSDDETEVVRLAEPVLHPNENRVDVNYQVWVKRRKDGAVSEVRETHRMRYLFAPELQRLLSSAGFDLAHAEEWVTGRPLGCDTWGACFVARAAALKGE